MEENFLCYKARPSVDIRKSSHHFSPTRNDITSIRSEQYKNYKILVNIIIQKYNFYSFRFTHKNLLKTMIVFLFRPA